jgi:hypothetical protein
MELRWCHLLMQKKYKPAIDIVIVIDITEFL